MIVEYKLNNYKMYYEFIKGLKWYYYLIPNDRMKGLFSDHHRNTLLHKFVVCWDFLNIDNAKNIKMYGVFKDYVDFAFFFLKLPKKLRSFYEIVIGENCQKPHFDLDMELTQEELDAKKDERIFQDLINAIIIVLLEKGIELDLERDICVYSSHGALKRSYHIVINNHCHSDNKQAKAFYFKVMERLPKEYLDKKYIDMAVYSKTQQFRIYGCAKAGSERFKKLVEKWSFNGIVINHKLPEQPDNENHEYLIKFEESVVGARITNCKLLPSFETEKKRDYIKGEDLEHDLAMEAVELLRQREGKKFPFAFDKIEGPFVILKRLSPSYCPICFRIHEHQNPYLLIVPENKNVFFHCRRALPKQNLFLGCLKKDDDTEEEKEEEEEEESSQEIDKSWMQNKFADLENMANKSYKKEKKKPVLYDVTDQIRKKIEFGNVCLL